MNEGGLEVLMKAMKSENENERIGAVRTVYFLSFNPTKAQVINEIYLSCNNILPIALSKYIFAFTKLNLNLF